jgi:hypothetical protein
MKPDRTVELARSMSEKQPGKEAFERADHYFNLYNEACGLPFNLAMSATTSVRSSDETESSSRVIDGTPATSWSSSKAGTKWLEFDFGDAYHITRYVIRQAGDSSRDLSNRDFTVQASADRASWTTVDAVAGNSSDVIDVDVEPVAARYLKVVVDDAGGNSTVSIADVEIDGSKKH